MRSYHLSLQYGVRLGICRSSIFKSRIPSLTPYIRHFSSKTAPWTVSPTPTPPPSSSSSRFTFRPRPPHRLLVQTFKLLCLMHLTYTYIIHVGAVEGPSMIPTIPPHGSNVVVLTLHRLGRGVEVGDIVCFSNPVTELDAAKRVLGLEGDYVLWDTPGNRDSDYGQQHGGKEPIIGATGRGEEEEEEEEEEIMMIQVPKGHVWLAGDNMAASRDSRTYGPVPMALIKGKIIAQWYPWSERQWFANPISGTTGLDMFRKLPDLIKFSK